MGGDGCGGSHCASSTPPLHLHHTPLVTPPTTQPGCCRHAYHDVQTREEGKEEAAGFEALVL